MIYSYMTAMNKKLMFLFILILLILLSITIYFKETDYFNISKRLECNPTQRYVLRECGFLHPNCERKGYCINTYTDGGKPCRSGKQCLSGVCNLSEETITIFKKQLPDSGFNTPNWTQIMTVPQGDLGFCKKDENDGSCFGFYVYIDSNDKINNPRCVE